ncbi:MAG: phosphoglucomutase (alpha-D-glucose-1,6-bisphosphate-dependent) [Desulfomonilaceae bacterium]
MTTHELAGKPAPRYMLANIPRLVTAYYSYYPVASDPACRVAFGTSGHRGSSFNKTFNETHVLAVIQALCEYRASKKITGPLFIGIDTHALSEPALANAFEVLAANEVSVMVQQGLRYTPTPAISHAILTHNRDRREGLADGVVITPSHNPPEDGGFKYNPPEGGPADLETTRAIEERANAIMAEGLKAVRRVPYEKALKADSTHQHDYITPYVEDLRNVIDMEVIAGEGLKIGVDPLGGAGIDFWDPIAERYHLSIEVVNRAVDPTFSFMTLDHDGKIRMDCSSPYAMARLIEVRNNFDVAFGNDADADRHGIVTKSAGLLNPNHYLSVAIWYLFQNRPGWSRDAAVGKTLVSTSLIDRVASSLGRRLVEVPVGFKWFVDELLKGTCGFGGEESAGASFLRRDGTVWTTDKDGILMDLLACEMTAKSGKDPGELYRELEEKFGRAFYERIDVPATSEQKAVLKNLSRDSVTAKELGGEPIVAKLTRAPANDAEIGGLKVVTQNGWFAARPSGTEDICKIYAESMRGKDHLQRIQEEATVIVSAAYKAAGL